MAEEREERAEHGEAQAVEGYGCICGFKTDNGKELRNHLMAMGKQDGKGAHESLGRINLQTGEVIMPPIGAGRYIQKVTGYSRSQVSRLIAEYKRTGHLRRTEYRRHRFPQKYTPSEIGLLARTDELHEWLSGPATKKIMEREYQVYGHLEFGNISRISIAHLYNLRRSNTYRGMAGRYTKTKPVVSRIGERVRPDPKGQPGYIRIDTVHQGDLNGQKGVYHINAVDEVTQWEIVASVERISEAYLVPVLETMLLQFPFITRGFHEVLSIGV